MGVQSGLQSYPDRRRGSVNAARREYAVTDDRLTEIEFKLAHQDQALIELNDVITDQQARIMQLEQLCESLLDKLQSLADAGPDEAPQHEIPPHY